MDLTKFALFLVTIKHTRTHGDIYTYIYVYLILHLFQFPIRHKQLKLLSLLSFIKMQAMARDMAQLQQSSPGTNNNNNNLQHQPSTIIEKQPITEEYVQLWINQLEQWTNIFYNEHNAQNLIVWQDAQAKLVQFQKIHDPLELCTEIIKKSRSSLVLYQATLCLKNAIANDFKKFDMEELYKLFQFLYEFLCSQALENDMCVNETTALICAMILKRIASERPRIPYVMTVLSAQGSNPTAVDQESDRIEQVITTLCNHIKEPNENLSKKVAASLMLSSLLLECQMTNKSTLLGIRVWKHLNARRQFEFHLKPITEVCLATINWAFSSNLLNPVNQTRETQILFHLVGSLIQCVEYALAFNSTDTGCTSGGDRVLRVIQSRTINMISQAIEHDHRLQSLREWCRMVMAPHIVQFLFDLYTTVKSLVNVVPGWSWPSNLLKNCLNCLYYLSDVHNSVNIERNAAYDEFVGNLMIGSVKIMEAETKGIDDSFQIACLITSISMHTSETRDTISRIKAEHFVPFLDAAQRFTCKVFTQVASAAHADEEEEEEKTVDALLDFWYHLLRNMEAEIRSAVSTNPPTSPKINTEGVKAYARVIVESYISCHLHKPLGQVVPRENDDIQEVDLDQADEQDDNTIHSQQLVSFGMISRFDALHTAKLLLELLSTRVQHLETLLTQFINTKPSPEGLKDWEYINDDIHWLLLMLQHYLTQTGFGEIGFMCNEILQASLSYGANVQKTLQAFEKFDYTTPEADPIVRLILIVLKLCQIEMGICQSGKIDWLSVQTNGTLTSLLSRFCLTYLYPKESDYSVISENMNYCFGQDAPTADKFLRFVVEHTCCIILCLKSDPQVVKKNITLLIQLQTYHPNVSTILKEADDGSMTMFVTKMHPNNLTGFPSKVAKLVLKLATRLYVEENDWNALIDFFTNKWSFIMTCIQNGQHQSEMVSTKFLEFCDFAIGVCEACDDETSERLFEQLLVPIVKALPQVLTAFGNFENVPIAIFELLYYIVKLPMVNITSWESPAAKTFYESCSDIIQAYSISPLAKKARSCEEEDCEDIIALLNFAHEVMKRDWGNSWASCDSVVKFAMDKLSVIIKPEYLQFPRIRSTYYRLLVYLVDEDDRLAHLSDTLLNTIVSSILLALQSKFDKEVDNHVYTIIGIICRTIYLEKGTQVSERLSKFMMPVLPALFHATINQGSFTLNTETAEMIAPAFFSLRCCFMNVYQSLVKDLIEKQDDPYAQAKVETLFENLESKIHKLTLNRTACREFSKLFVPFLAELHNYVTTK